MTTYSVPAIVLSVDKSKNTCEVEPLDGSADFVDVPLQADKGKGMVLYPVIGSVVIVSMLDKDSAFVSMVSEVELIDFQTQNESLKTLIEDLIAAIKAITVTTPSGPSGTPVNFAQFDSIKTRLSKLFK